MKKCMYLLLTSMILLMGCETEKEQYERLQKELINKRQEYQSENERWNFLKKEQEKSWKSNAKSRFAIIEPINIDEWYDVTNASYIKNIKVSFLGKDKYKVKVKIKSSKTMKPQFLIHLYNDRGLIIGQCHEKKSFLSKKLIAGQSIEKEYKIETENDTPAYFFAEILE